MSFFRLLTNYRSFLLIFCRFMCLGYVPGVIWWDILCICVCSTFEFAFAEAGNSVILDPCVILWLFNVVKCVLTARGCVKLLY